MGRLRDPNLPDDWNKYLDEIEARHRPFNPQQEATLRRLFGAVNTNPNRQEGAA